MTIAEKSTELNRDLAEELFNQITNSGASIQTHEIGGAFHCYQIEGPLAPANDHNGTYFYYFCSEGTTLTEASTLQEIKDAFKNYVNAEAWSEKAVEKTSVIVDKTA